MDKTGELLAARLEREFATVASGDDDDVQATSTLTSEQRQELEGLFNAWLSTAFHGAVYRLAKMEDQLSDLIESVETLESRLNTVVDDVDELETAKGDYEDVVEKLGNYPPEDTLDRVETMETELESVSEKLGALEKLVGRRE